MGFLVVFYYLDGRDDRRVFRGFLLVRIIVRGFFLDEKIFFKCYFLVESMNVK